MKAYDDKATCPKCGGSEVATFWMPKVEDDPGWHDRIYKPVGKWPKGEFIRRQCKRCQYAWPEEVIPEPGA